MPYVAVALTLHASVLAGCGLGQTDQSCQEQMAVADRLAADPALAKLDVNAVGTSSYQNYPCEENSGGSLVTAGLRYEVAKPVTADDLFELGRKAAGTGRWEMIAEIRPDDPGSGGDAHACYRAATSGVHRYLTLHADSATTTSTASADGTLGVVYVEVSQSDSAVEVCPTAR